MENTLENKEKFFAQYWGQEVKKYLIQTDATQSYYNVSDNFGMALKDAFLELKPLSQISYEDSAEVAKVSSKVIEAVDCLRSKGYALPWNSLSVEKQIEYGWVRLKTE